MTNTHTHARTHTNVILCVSQETGMIVVVTDAKTAKPFYAAGGEPSMLARDGTPRVYNRTKDKMAEVLENWQYYPIFVKPHPTAGWLYMPLEGFGYEMDQHNEFLNYESLIVLPAKFVLSKLGPLLDKSLGYPFKPTNVAELFQRTTAASFRKFAEWYVVLLRMTVA